MNTEKKNIKPVKQVQETGKSVDHSVALYGKARPHLKALFEAGKFNEFASRGGNVMDTHSAKSEKAKKGTKKAMIKAAHLGVVQKHDFMRQAISEARTLCQKRSLLLMEKKDFDMKYVTVQSDGKTSSPQDDKLALIEAEFKAMRGMAKSMFGGQAFKTDLIETFSLDTGTGGVLAKAQAVNPQPLTEWSYLASLFDEYRVIGGKVQFVVHGPMLWVATSAGTNQAMGAWAYDPADNVALTLLAQAAAFQTHKYFPCNTIVTGNTAGNTLTASMGTMLRNDLHTCHYKVPKGILDNTQTGTSGGIVNGSWQSTGGSVFLTYGGLYWFGQIFFQTTAATTTQVGYVTHSIHTEFRIRE